MGSRGLGGSLRFRLNDLEHDDKLKIMDTAFALVDRVRFELMRRLGWVEEIAGDDVPIIGLVQQAWRRAKDFARDAPSLSGTTRIIRPMPASIPWTGWSLSGGSSPGRSRLPGPGGIRPPGVISPLTQASFLPNSPPRTVVIHLRLWHCRKEDLSFQQILGKPVSVQEAS